MEITYRMHGDFYVPNLLISEAEPATYGRFGRMRAQYLKAHRRGAYTTSKASDIWRHGNSFKQPLPL